MVRGKWVALLLTGLLAAFLLLPSVTGAQTVAGPTEPTRTLNVTGQGRIEVKPDTATINLGISQLQPTPAEAYAAMSADLVKIAGAVKSMGVKEDAIQTSTFNLHTEYNWTQEKGQVLAGYRATTNLAITTRELDKVALLIQAAVEAGANQLNGITFSVRDAERLMAQVLDLAADDAKMKADRVATRMGAKVVRVLSVSIHDSGIPMEAAPMAAADGVLLERKAAPAPVYGGSSAVTATVSVTFEIQ